MAETYKVTAARGATKRATVPIPGQPLVNDVQLVYYPYYENDTQYWHVSATVNYTDSSKPPMDAVFPNVVAVDEATMLGVVTSSINAMIVINGVFSKSIYRPRKRRC